MTTIARPYDQFDLPMVPVISVNLRTGQSIEVEGLVDTGADKCSLSSELMGRLGIVEALDREDLYSTAGRMPKGFQMCNYLAFSVVDHLGHAHFPAGRNIAIPSGFSPMKFPQCILGRFQFLDLMTVTFEGLSHFVRMDF